MDSAAPVAIHDVYDRRDGGMMRTFAGLGIAMAILITAVANSHFLIVHHHGGVLPLAWLLLVILSLGMPRVVVDVIQEHRGVPALRFSDEGIWARRWSRLGWIKWSDISAVIVATGRVTNEDMHELRVELRRSAYARVRWFDRLTQSLTALLGLMFGVRTASAALPLINSKAIAGSWDDLMAALDPILLRHNIPIRFEGRSLESRAGRR